MDTRSQAADTGTAVNVSSSLTNFLPFRSLFMFAQACSIGENLTVRSGVDGGQAKTLHSREMELFRGLVWAKIICPWANYDQQLRGFCPKKWIWAKNFCPWARKFCPSETPKKYFLYLAKLKSLRLECMLYSLDNLLRQRRII
jgi:hypothetical protein